MSREGNRSQFPYAAECVDELRAGGFNPKLVWARNDAGEEVGVHSSVRYAGCVEVGYSDMVIITKAEREAEAKRNQRGK